MPGLGSNIGGLFAFSNTGDGWWVWSVVHWNVSKKVLLCSAALNWAVGIIQVKRAWSNKDVNRTGDQLSVVSM